MVTQKDFFGTWSKSIDNEVIDKALGEKPLIRLVESTKVCSNHFQYGKPTDSYPHPTLKIYNDNGPSKPKRSLLDRSVNVNQTHTEFITVGASKNTENCKAAEEIGEETADGNFRISESSDCVAQNQERTPQR